MEVAFSILLDSAGYNLARRYQLKILQKFQAKEALLIGPHVTIKYAFFANDFIGVERYFDGIAQRTHSFEIELSGISSFEENHVVFLNIIKSEELTKIHLKVLEDLVQRFHVTKAEFEGSNLHFHITLAYKDITSETFKSIMEDFKDESVSQKVVVKQFGLWLRISPEEKWFLYKIKELQLP